MFIIFFAFRPSRLLLSFVVFVVAPLRVRREVLEWIQEWKTKFIRNEISHYLYFDKFWNISRFLPRTLAKKLFNSQGNTLEIGYISYIPEIPKKILPALFFPLFFKFIIFISNAQFVVVERSCYLLNKVYSNDIKCKVFIEPTIKVFTNITCCLVVTITTK